MKALKGTIFIDELSSSGLVQTNVVSLNPDYFYQPPPPE